MFDTVKKNIEKQNILDVGDNKSINFKNIIDFSKDIIDGKINNFNKEKKYNEKFKNIEKKFRKSKKNTNDIKLYIFYLNQLKRILFTPKKSSGTQTKIPQIVRKRDDKVRTFAPKDFKKSSGTPTKIPQIVRKKDSLPKYNEKSNRLKNFEEEYQNITEEKYIPDPNKVPNIEKDDFIDPVL